MDLSRWNKETRQAYVGTLAYSLLGILAAILAPIAAASKLAKAFGGGGGSGMTVLLVIVELAVICGYIIFFLAVKDLKEITEGEDKSSFGKIWIAIILSILGAALFFVPVVPGLLSLCSCILLLIAYSRLSKSQSIGAFSPNAVVGFGKLYTAEILAIIGAIIGFIPLIGVVGAILNVISWILVLVGWKRVATPVAVPGEAPVEEKPLYETVKEVVSESIVEAKEVAKDAADKAQVVAGEVADKAKEVAKDAADKAKEAAENIKEKLD